MKHAAVGCLIGLGGWLAMACAIAGLLQSRQAHRLVETIGVSAFAGLAGWAALNLLYASFRCWRERAALAGGIAGLPPADGARAVLVGTIEARGEVLRAPLDGTPCLAYDYRVTEDRGSGKRRMHVVHFRGAGLAPSLIRTRTGRYPLLTVPDLECAALSTPQPGRVAAFERYLRATPFGGPDSAAQELVNRWTDADGAYRSDVAYSRLDAVDLRQCQLVQQLVRPGAAVCVIGVFSAARGGIVPSPSWAAGARLIEGSVTQVMQTLRSSATRRLGLALVCAMLATGLVAAFIGDGQARPPGHVNRTFPVAYGPVPSTSASARSQSSSACPSVRPRATYRA